MDHGEQLGNIGRLLTQEDYEDLEATVQRHGEYLAKIVEILREQDDEIRQLRSGRSTFPNRLAKP